MKKTNPEVFAKINDKLEELYAYCQEAKLSMVAAVHAPDLDRSGLFLGGSSPDFIVMAREIILAIVGEFKKSAEAITETQLSKQSVLAMGGVVLEQICKEVLDTLEFGPKEKGPRFTQVDQEILNIISVKVEEEIAAKLDEILVDKPLNKELVALAKVEVEAVLERNFLSDKIAFSIHIAPDGVAEVSFKMRKKMEHLN